MCLVIILSQFFAVVLRFLTQPGKEQALRPGLDSSVLQATAPGLSKILPAWLTPEVRPGQALDLHNRELLRTSLLSDQKALGRPRLPRKQWEGGRAVGGKSRGDVLSRWQGTREGSASSRQGPRKDQVVGSSGRQGSHPRATAQRT